MVIVLDPNVLVSGLLNPFGPPARVVDYAVSTKVQVAFDDRIVGEYIEVLSRPIFGFDPRAIRALVDHLRLTGVQVSADPLNPEQLPDPNDLPFAEVAVGVNADFLVTGNPTHFEFLARHSVSVVSPSDFVAAIERLSGV